MPVENTTATASAITGTSRRKPVRHFVDCEARIAESTEEVINGPIQRVIERVIEPVIESVIERALEPTMERLVMTPILIFFAGVDARRHRHHAFGSSLRCTYGEDRLSARHQCQQRAERHDGAA